MLRALAADEHFTISTIIMIFDLRKRFSPFYHALAACGLLGLVLHFHPRGDIGKILIVALCFYLPLTWSRLTQVDLTPQYESNWREVGRGLAWGVGGSLVVYSAYLLAAHLWLTRVMGFHFSLRSTPAVILFAKQFMFAALPEEFFFRGFIDTLLQRIWPPRWNLLGARVGGHWLVTALLFALTHSLVHLQWWHIGIVIPGVWFGYLRARTGGLLAPTIAHVCANVISWWIGWNYVAN